MPLKTEPANASIWDVSEEMSHLVQSTEWLWCEEGQPGESFLYGVTARTAANRNQTCWFRGWCLSNIHMKREPVTQLLSVEVCGGQMKISRRIQVSATGRLHRTPSVSLI